jgi:hypothetical protein
VGVNFVHVPHGGIVIGRDGRTTVGMLIAGQLKGHAAWALLDAKRETISTATKVKKE